MRSGWRWKRRHGDVAVDQGHGYEVLTVGQSLTACPDNSNAACDFSGKALIMRCNGKTLDANLEKRMRTSQGLNNISQHQQHRTAGWPS